MKKRIIALLLAVVMTVGMVFSLSSCGKENSKIYVYLGDQLFDFDPAIPTVSDDAAEIMNMLYEPLFRLKANGDVEKALAKSYRIIEDEENGLYQMEITLRETYWSDGQTSVSADDVAFAWRRILDPYFESQAAPLLYDIKNAVAVKKGELSVYELGIEANKDVLTITFETEIDYDGFLRNLTSVSLTPLRENIVKQKESFWSKKRNTISSNGPFALRTINFETGEFELERNAYYRSETGESGNKYVGPMRLVSKWTDENYRNFLDEYEGDMNAFLQGKLDKFLAKTVFVLGEMPADQKTRLEYEKKVKTADLLSTYSYVFNTKNELFADARVRQALSMVIDREYLAEQLVFAVAADGFISNGVWDATSASEKKSFRAQAEALIATKPADNAMSEAQRLLSEAGVSGGKFTLTVRDNAEEIFVAYYAASVWEELGFNVNLNFVTYDTEVWATDKNEGTREVITNVTPKPDGTFDVTKMDVRDDAVQAMYMDGAFDVLGVDYQMYSTNAFAALCGFSSHLNGNGFVYNEETGESIAQLHCSGFSDPAYDAIIDRALAEKDLEKRAAILHEAEAYLVDKMPVMPLYYNVAYYLVTEVKGGKIDGYGYYNFTDAKSRSNYDEDEIEESKNSGK